MCEKIWTLMKATVSREVDEEGTSSWPLKEESWEFASFEEARTAFRKLARECALQKNDVFDGDGNIRSLQEQFGWIVKNYESQLERPEANHMIGSMILRGAPDVAYMAGDFESAKALPASLRKWLLNMEEYNENPLPDFRWTNWSSGIVSKRDFIALGGLSDIERIELYDAQVYTNAFNMDDPEGDYEFSVRAWFDPYDQDAGALRIRLVKGPASTGGHYTWPEEDDNWPPFHEPAPCLEGAFDGNGYITVHIRPGRDSEKTLSDEIVDGYEGFIDSVAALGVGAGLIVDVSEQREDPDGEWASTRMSFYKAEGEGCWFELRVWVHYKLHLRELIPPPAHLNMKPQKRDKPPINVSGTASEQIGGECFEDYDQALEEVKQLIEKHVANIDKPKDPNVEKPEVIRLDIVCNLGNSD